ncbi:MAG: CHAT domain-containing protein [Cyanobacteria bacterium P01_F01_bin.150]
MTSFSVSRLYSRLLPFCLWAFLGLWLALGGSFIAVYATESAAISSVTVDSNQSLLQTGITAFQSQRYREAIATWETALAQSPETPYNLNRALLLSNLSLAHQHLGELAKADLYVTEALRLFAHTFEEEGSDRHSLLDWEYYAKALNAQGWLQWRQGNLDQALEAWQQSTVAYDNAAYQPGVIGSLLNQAKVLQTLGLSRETEETLLKTQTLLDAQSDPQLKSLGLRSLGIAYRQLGKLEQSITALTDGLQHLEVQLQPTNLTATQASLFLELGNTERARWTLTSAINPTVAPQHRDDALNCYHQAASIAPSTLAQLQADANELSLYIDVLRQEDRGIELNIGSEAVGTCPLSSDIKGAASLGWISGQWQHIQASLAQLPPSRAAIELQLNVVNSLTKLRGTLSESELLEPTWAEMGQALAIAVDQATQLDDGRTASYAMGQLAHIYERNGQWANAQSLTKEAIRLIEAKDIQAEDILYRWEWQLGRILAKQGKRERAIAAYDSAYKTLKTIRGNLISINADIQFSFRDNVEPIYREFADLLLQADSGYPDIYQANLKRATEVIDDLQLAELENFLGCNLSSRLQLSERTVDPTAAIIYPIILSDRIEVILKLPNTSKLYQYTQFVPASEVDDTLKQLLFELGRPYRSPEGKALGQQVYDWVIKPLKRDLKTAHIKTLVFALDGSLRSIPMAALYNEETVGNETTRTYLIEEYALAITPGLNLIEPQPLKQISLDTLAFGLSQLRKDFPIHEGFLSLPYVENELDEIQNYVSIESFLNQAFTVSTLEEQTQASSFPILHLATHGQFSSDPSETFILTWDKRVGVNQLSNILRQRDQRTLKPIELLILSACQTATGDNRAALGLAGVAVQSGARSTIATLWTVDDISTADVMSALYKELSKTDVNLTKAEALQRAQVQLLQQNVPPQYWAPYILIGNWL